MNNANHTQCKLASFLHAKKQGYTASASKLWLPREAAPHSALCSLSERRLLNETITTSGMIKRSGPSIECLSYAHAIVHHPSLGPELGSSLYVLDRSCTWRLAVFAIFCEYHVIETLVIQRLCRKRGRASSLSILDTLSPTKTIKCRTIRTGVIPHLRYRFYGQYFISGRRASPVKAR